MTAAALERVNAVPSTRVLRVADAIETEPVDCPPGSPAFLNTAAVVETELHPVALLDALLAIEAELGRSRDGAAATNAPRPIDLDLLMYDDLILSTPTLTLPHPRMHVRRFVLEPLATIAPDVVHPTTRKSIATLLAELP